VIGLVERHSRVFYIRAKRCAKMNDMIGSVAKGSWEKIRLNMQEMEVADIPGYCPFVGDKPYMSVISKIRRRISQTDTFSGEAYTFLGILTNDTESTNREVVAFYYAKGGKEPDIIGQRHEVLTGFEETDILPFGGVLATVRVDPKADVLMTYVPEFPVFPPEMAWMRTPVTDIPGLVVNETPQGGKVVTFLADIDRRFSRDNIPDHGTLLENVIRWSAGDTLPMSVEGPGLIESHLYRQNNLLILHLINLTNAATWRHPVEERMPIGPIKIKIMVPETAAFTNADLKVANRPVELNVTNGTLELVVESVSSHEMLVIS
jgi:hypothetical protein